jgi:RHS repeat-associated protein
VGVGPLKSKTVIVYDGAALVACPTGAPNHDDTNYGCSFATRGNPTSITRYIDPQGSTGPLTTELRYDSLGNLRSSTDPGGHATNFSYTDNYSDSVNRNSLAYLTQITKPSPFNSQTVSLKYFYNTGQLASTTDENGRVTSFVYADSMLRPTQTDFADGGRTTVAYNDASRTVTTTVKRTDAQNLVVMEVFNQLGLLTQQQLPGSRKIDLTYDTYGRLWKTSNPYVVSGEATSGIVETQLDPLGRVTKTVNQEGTFVLFEYSRSATRVTDEVGRQRLFETDALGRVVKVCEVTAGNTRSPAESCGVTTYGGTGYLTTHAYDVLDNRTQTVQGVQTRTAAYDALSRMTAAKIIEISTSANVTYAYDADGNLLSVADPRGPVNYEYDELHRQKRKKHGTTVVASYSYDGTQANNAIGRLITEKDGDFGSNADRTDYTYDTLGRVKTANRVISGTTYAMNYTYDFVGNPTAINYPSSSGTRRLVEYAYHASGELDKVTDGTNPSAKFDYVTGTTYSNLGPPQQVNFANAVQTTLGWNKRGLVTSIVTQKSPSPTHLSLNYAYYASGQIQEITNGLNSLKSEKNTYDEIRRLLTAQRGPDANIQRKYEYEYDRYGNRWKQDWVAGAHGLDREMGFNSSNNRTTEANYTYNLSGDLVAIGSGTAYTYDLENFTASAYSTQQSLSEYKVDAQGRRVRKTRGTTVTEYFYSGAELIAEKEGSTWTDYIFFGSQRIVKQTGSTLATATFLHPDHQGSTRVCTDSNGNSNGTCDYEPFGENQPGSTCSIPTNFRFAGMEWDPNAGPNGLYKTWFRYYDQDQGRWLAPDPLPGSPDEPQSLNRYAYSGNDPINRVDPLGLVWVCVEWWAWFTREENGEYTYVDNSVHCHREIWVEISFWGDDEGIQLAASLLDEIAKGGFKSKPNCRDFLQDLIKQNKLNISVDQLIDRIISAAHSARNQVYDGPSATAVPFDSSKFTGAPDIARGTVADVFAAYPTIEALNQYNGSAIWIRANQWAPSFLGLVKSDYNSPYGKATLFHELLHKKQVTGRALSDDQLRMAALPFLSGTLPKGVNSISFVIANICF